MRSREDYDGLCGGAVLALAYVAAMQTPRERTRQDRTGRDRSGRDERTTTTGPERDPGKATATATELAWGRAGRTGRSHEKAANVKTF